MSDPQHGQGRQRGFPGHRRLARYLLRPPLSLEPLSWTPENTVLYRRRDSSRFGHGETHFDPLDFLARVLRHIPQPKLHTVRYDGHNSGVARARRRADGGQVGTHSAANTALSSTVERRRLR